MNPQDTTNQETLPTDFESALRALEACVSEMEKGELTLEASLKAYQKGVELARICQRSLDAAQQKVQVLEGELLKPLSPDTDESAQS